jgi:multidrug efflux pump subunit AcrA (membrane-fusion protein)
MIFDAARAARARSKTLLVATTHRFGPQKTVHVGGERPGGPLKIALPPTDIAVVRVLPKNQGDMVQFCLDRYPVWEQQTKAIGLSAEQVQRLIDLSKTARDTMAAAEAARAAARAATLAQKEAAAQLRAYAGGLIATIKAYASTAGVGDQHAEPEGAILARAMIPVPLK